MLYSYSYTEGTNSRKSRGGVGEVIRDEKGGGGGEEGVCTVGVGGTVAANEGGWGGGAR